MRTFGFFSLSLFVLAGLVSCMHEDFLCSSVPDRQDEGDAKIINTTVGAIQARLLVRLDGDTVRDSSETASLFGVEDCIGYRKVFSSDMADDELAVSKGLDRWFEVRLDENADLRAMAEYFASCGQVEIVQFDTKPVPASDCRSLPYRPAARQFSSGNASTAFNDHMLPDQWHFKNTGNTGVTPTVKAGADINVTDAWRIVTGNPGVIVAVVDGGVQYDHPDLAANMWTNPNETANGLDDDGNGLVDDIHGWNFAAGGPVTWTEPGDVGHGTHVAGTVAAVNGNNTGVAGVAGGTGNGDGVKIMSCQIFSGFLDGGGAATAAAIMYAADHGAHVLQCSWGFPAGSYMSDRDYRLKQGLVADAIDYFLEKPNDILDGGVVVFAAGNEGLHMSAYPAALVDCISVTSFAADGLPAYYTCYGPGCNIAAPGGEYCTGGVDRKHEQTLVLSTMPTVSLPLYDSFGNQNGTSAKDYGYMQGTSMACPHVSGIAALGLSYLKKAGRTMSKTEFEDILLTSVDDINGDLKGTKKSLNMSGEPATWSVSRYRNKMGTGAVNAWRFLMALEGTPCLTVKCGESQSVSLDRVFGGGSSYLTYTSVEISEEDMAALGLVSAPEISEDGLLRIEPTRAGSAKMTIRAIAGGSSMGGGNSIGGSEILREVSVISRNVVSGNGGWL